MSAVLWVSQIGLREGKKHRPKQSRATRDMAFPFCDPWQGPWAVKLPSAPPSFNGHTPASNVSELTEKQDIISLQSCSLRAQNS